jgi:cytochrome c2
MPRARFQHARDADDVAAWLASLGSPQAGVEFAAGAAERGAARFLELGCVACHVAPERDRADAALGDRLSLWYVCAKWQPGALVDFLQDPRRSYEHVRMPDFALSRDDAMALAAYLLSAQVEALPAVKGDAERGRKLAQEHRCDACHALDLPISGRREARLRNLKPDRGCLASDAAAPDHGLSQDDIAAVRAFLPFTTSVPFRRAPLDFARRHLRAARCTACHGFDGEPSTWARVAEQAQAKAPLPVEQDPVAQGVPALTWVGEKLQPSWISRFVTGAEPSPRPWLHARMPAFHRFGPAVAQGLVRAHGYGQQDEPARAGDAQSAIFGERLVQIGQGFGCVQCHAIGDKPAVQVFERAGINLAVARRRLRHEYYSRWLLDPPRIDPDARMSRYADAKGKTPFTDVLGGDAAKQFEAIWQHLGTLR